MANEWGLGLHFIFVTIVMAATTHTGLGAPNTTVVCFKHERLALLKFKHSVTNDHDMLSSWVGKDCCRWERVICDRVTRNVESLYLGGDDIYPECLDSKELGASLKELSHLKHLDLSRNDFRGSRIPEFIGSLKKLTYLNLSHAFFSGVIPHHIGNLSNLIILDLNSSPDNDLLMAHDMTWISGLSSLEHLDLSFVNLSRAKILDVVLYMTPSLKVLSLSFCDLLIDDHGPLRNSSTTLSNIEHLDLSSNYFTGKLPRFFQNMTSLQFLDLSYFDLSASSNFASNFESLLSMIPSLSKLYLSACNLKETCLSHILHNSTTLSNIEHLDLSHNKLTGSIPGSLGELKLLQVLDLSANRLTGPIPTFSEKLSELYLSSNLLNGSIPESFGRLTALTDLDLSYNQLSGTIPVSVGQLSKLRTLDISRNSLEGVVYESHFANLPMLKDLNAAFNTRLTFNVSLEWLPPFQLTSSIPVPVRVRVIL